MRRTREKVRQAKEAYSSAINCRSASQREVNELLQRKHAWTPTDLERFTSLYRSDHVNERAEIETQEALSNAEREAEEATAELSKNILTRYHEEQVWSDKIRRMSTWGTWGLMGVNVLLFLVFQIAVEPWRRRRLVKGFEEKVAEALEKENSRHTKEISAAIEQEKPTFEPENDSGAVASDTSDLPEGTTGKPESAPEMPAEGMPTQHTSVEAESTIPELPPLTPMLPPDLDLAPEAWRKTSQAFFTERRVTILQRDLTTVVLESAAVGAAVMGGILFAISRLS